MTKKIFTGLATLMIIGFLLVGGYVASEFYSSYQGDTTKFTIAPGEGFSSVNYKLKKQKIITNARMFHYYAKWTDKVNKLKAGTYKIPAGTNIPSLLDILTSGVGELTRVTIPEGKNMYEVGKILEKHKITTYEDFIKACKSKKLVKSLGVEAPSLEGYLFPETYFFAPDTPAEQVAVTMLNLFSRKTKDIDLQTSNLSAHEVVILASIVEKETGAKWERPDIAGVYLNRLKKRMRLQADPTTIYGIWEKYNGNLKRKHLLEKTDYNTYKMSGLPLGPIANPSLAAIKAVLKPNKHNYIYFVSKNDGTHVFTPTYKEHLKAVDYWQRNYKRRKGKSWRDLKQ